MTLLYQISAYLTLPGALLRAFLEHILLKCMHVPVEDTKYLQPNELCGHIEHKPVRTPGKNFVLNVIPGLLLLLFGFPMAVVSGVQLFYFGINWTNIHTGEFYPLFILYVLLYYFGMALLCNLAPTHEDALYFAESFKESKNVFVKILLAIPVLCCRIGALVSKIMLPLLLAVGATLLFIFI